MILLFLGIIIFIGGVYSFISFRKFLLNILLRLEFIILRFFFILFKFLLLGREGEYILMMFLVFVVCEGALGLSILVRIIRTHGNNYFQSFGILIC